MTKRDFSRLPKWAQHEIETLDYRVQFLERAASPNPKSNTTCGVEAFGTKRDLPHESPVQFHTNRKKRGSIETTMSNGSLNIVASQPISVRRVTDNCVQVRIASSQ